MYVSPGALVCCCKVCFHLVEPLVHIVLGAGTVREIAEVDLDQVAPCQKHLAMGVELGRPGENRLC